MAMQEPTRNGSRLVDGVRPGLVCVFLFLLSQRNVLSGRTGNQTSFQGIVKKNGKLSFSVLLSKAKSLLFFFFSKGRSNTQDTQLARNFDTAKVHHKFWRGAKVISTFATGREWVASRLNSTPLYVPLCMCVYCHKFVSVCALYCNLEAARWTGYSSTCSESRLETHERGKKGRKKKKWKEIPAAAVRKKMRWKPHLPWPDRTVRILWWMNGQLPAPRPEEKNTARDTPDIYTLFAFTLKEGYNERARRKGNNTRDR